MLKKEQPKKQLKFMPFATIMLAKAKKGTVNNYGIQKYNNARL